MKNMINLPKKMENETKKKTYNPFKMWGSWVGASLTWVYLLIGSISIAVRHNQPFIFFLPSSEFAAIGWIILIGLTIAGFLIGWGIHSLIRRYKK